MSVEQHFNDIWGARRRLPVVQAFQKYAVFYTLLSVGPLLDLALFLKRYQLGVRSCVPMGVGLLRVFPDVHCDAEYVREVECRTARYIRCWNVLPDREDRVWAVSGTVMAEL